MEVAKVFKTKISACQIKIAPRLSLFGNSDPGITKKIAKKIMQQIDLETCSGNELKQFELKLFLKLPSISTSWCILFKSQQLQKMREEAKNLLQPKSELGGNV